MSVRKFLTRRLLPVSMIMMLTGFFASVHATPYQVTGGNQLDGETYRGYQVFRAWCARCHGTYGQGLAAPNLAVSLNKLSKQEFMAVLQKNTVGAHRASSWVNNAQVLDNREAIYRYLKARADGAIGVLQPELAQ